MVLPAETRRLSLGASEAAAALGESPYTSPLELWAVKTGRMPEADLSDREPVQWGKILEPIIVREFAKRTGRIVDHNYVEVPLVHPDFPFLTATPDGLQRRPNVTEGVILEFGIPDDLAGPGVVEAKAVSEWKRDEWAGGKAPLFYQIQVQHQLAVTGLGWGSLVALVGGQKLEWIDVQRDDDFIRSMIAAEGRFWDCVQSDRPPKTDGSDSCTETLKRLYHEQGNGFEVVELPLEADDWDVELQAVKEALKTLETRKKVLENHLKIGIGMASIGALPSGAAYTWKTITKTDPPRPARTSSYRVLRRVKKVPVQK